MIVYVLPRQIQSFSIINLDIHSYQSVPVTPAYYYKKKESTSYRINTYSVRANKNSVSAVIATTMNHIDRQKSQLLSTVAAEGRINEGAIITNEFVAKFYSILMCVTF